MENEQMKITVLGAAPIIVAAAIAAILVIRFLRDRREQDQASTGQ